MGKMMRKKEWEDRLLVHVIFLMAFFALTLVSAFVSFSEDAFADRSLAKQIMFVVAIMGLVGMVVTLILTLLHLTAGRWKYRLYARCFIDRVQGASIRKVEITDEHLKKVIVVGNRMISETIEFADYDIGVEYKDCLKKPRFWVYENKYIRKLVLPYDSRTTREQLEQEERDQLAAQGLNPDDYEESDELTEAKRMLSLGKWNSFDIRYKKDS